ncbi:MAG: class I SAM-dependent methyltransferase [Alphaproteobacteria bacterium]|nr:class I SAM-dependent methyltransferase [Alphaproteobacteria bacterium]
MSQPEKYCLPGDYKENLVRSTMDMESGSTYWNAQRLANSINYQYAVYQYAIEQIRKHNFKSVIDVGCGPAMKLSVVHKACPDVSITGIDQAHPIEFCKTQHKFGQWLVDDFENPDAALAHIKADLVICSDVIEHLIDPDKLLSYIKTRVNPGGMALISTPDRDRHYGPGLMKSGHKDHVREWNFPEFAAYIKSRGWDLIEHKHLSGIRPGINRAFLYSVIYHFKENRPSQFDCNQAVLLRPL